MRVIRLPYQGPVANAYAERWFGSAGGGYLTEW